MKFWWLSHQRATNARADLPESLLPIGTASANSMESDLGCMSRVYFDNVTLLSHNWMLTSQKPCQYNNKFGCSDTNGHKNKLKLFDKMQ